MADSNNAGVRNARPGNSDTRGPQTMPGGVGLSGGQSGTGTTSGH